MPWKETNAMEQRKAFIDGLVCGNWTMTELCERFGISRVTGYKWWERFRRSGYEGLAERSRAPRRCPHRTPSEVEQALIAFRTKHPKWGAETLLELVRRDHPDWQLPARSTAADILKRNGLVKPRRSRSRPRHPGRPYVEMKEPNDVWPADFKGQFKTKDGRYCYPLTVTDGRSRYLLSCKSLRSTGHPGVKAEFTRIFREYGLPKQILTDNGVPFASQALCGLSKLSIWWIKLGIHPVRIEPGRPNQNGRHERMHKTLASEGVRPVAADAARQQERFDEFCRTFNTVRPHHALDMKTPASIYTSSPRSFPEAIEPFEYPKEFTIRKIHAHGCFIWHQKHVFVSRVLANERIALEQIDEHLWSIHFGPVLLARFDTQRGRISS